MNFMSHVDKDKPYTWYKYKDGMCEHCQAICCEMPVEVTKADLLKMGLISEFDMDEPGKKLAKRLIKEKIVKHYRHKTDLFMLEQGDEGFCIMFDIENHGCKVYKNMPEACVNFPAVSSRPGFCPYIRK